MEHKTIGIDVTKYSPFNRDQIKLSDGNTIFVNLSTLAIYSKFIRTILEEYDTRDKYKDVVYTGDIYTYGLIHKICNLETDEKQESYIEKHIQLLNGTTILNTMEYLLLESDMVAYVLDMLIALPLLNWNHNLSSKILSNIVEKIIDISDVREGISNKTRAIITINNDYIHLIDKLRLHDLITPYILNTIIHNDEQTLKKSQDIHNDYSLSDLGEIIDEITMESIGSPRVKKMKHKMIPKRS